MHEFPFPIAILNGGTLFFRETTRSIWSKSRLSKAGYNNNSIMFYFGGRVIIFTVMFFHVCPKSIIVLYRLEVVMPVMIYMFFLVVFTIYNANHFNA